MPGSGNAYDYIVVGAGSAGCVLATRLSENPDVRVLVLEAGGWDRGPYIHIPLAWGRLFARRYFDWMYDTQPEPRLNNRRLECARGRVVGGSSSTNGMAYGRGHRSDYDGWAAAGLEGWAFEDVLPYFRKSENWAEGETPYRGGSGPVNTRRNGLDDPLVDAWFKAGASMNIPFNDDYNAGSLDGFTVPQFTVRNGMRCSASKAYLRPALRRPNLHVITNALATRVLFDGARASGVEYLHNGAPYIAKATGEVILAGGVINSPQLLMLSGIGAPKELAKLGIKTVADVPGVGQNLHDHMTIGLEYARKDIGPFLANLRYDRFARMVGEAIVYGTGMATSLPMGCKAYVRSPVAKNGCDLTLLFRATNPNPKQYWQMRSPEADGFGYRILLLKPESRGSIRVVSKDPTVHPHIHQNFLESERDWKALRGGFRMVRELTSHPEVAKFVDREILPGSQVVSDAEIDEHIRATASTAHHPVGTCKMAADSDPMGVVDAKLRVRGTSGLRVVDASIMPEIVSGPPNAVVMMIGEKGADMIASATNWR